MKVLEKPKTDQMDWKLRAENTDEQLVLERRSVSMNASHTEFRVSAFWAEKLVATHPEIHPSPEVVFKGGWWANRTEPKTT